MLWKSNESTVSPGPNEPITSDNHKYKIGEFCLDDFYVHQTRTLHFDIRGKNGTNFCTIEKQVYGCIEVPECMCEEFRKSVKLVSVKVGLNNCCYRLYVDATKIGCDINEIRMYKGNTPNPTYLLTEGGHGPVSSSFSGFLASFCPNAALGVTGQEHLFIEFLDAGGLVICNTVVTAACSCNCAATSDAASGINLDVKFTPVTIGGVCCYEIRVKNSGLCKLDLSSLSIKPMTSTSTISAPGWTIGAYDASYQSRELTRANGSITLYPETEILIGKICQTDCALSEPSAFVVDATYGSCSSAARVNKNTSTSSCPVSANCNDFQISTSSHSAAAGGPCCQTDIFVKLMFCKEAKSGLSVRIEGPNGQIITSAQAPLDYSFRLIGTIPRCINGSTFVVKLLRSDGSVLCFKTITLDPCADYPYAIRSSGSGNQGNAGYSDLEDEGIHESELNRPTDIYYRHNDILVDERSILGSMVWFIVDLNGVVVSSSGSASHQQSLEDGMRPLHSGSYVIRVQNFSGEFEIRRCNVVR